MEALALRMPDCVQEYRRERCFSSREQNVNLALRFEGRCSFKQSRHILHIQFVDVTGRICVHVAGRTHRVTAVREIDDQIRTSSRLDAVRTVIVYSFIAAASEISTESKALHPSEEIGMIGKDVFERTVFFAGLTHQNASSFLQDFCLDNSGLIPEVSNSGVTVDHRVHCFSIAVWA